MRSANLWRNADFTYLWGAATVSTFGSLITRTAIPFTAILLLDASAADLSALRVAELLPAFVVGLAAGAWVDRLRRRPIMIAADLGRAALLFTVPVAAVAGWLGMFQLLLVLGLVSILGVFFDVAYQSHLPSVVRQEQLIEANSKLTAAASVAEAASFSAAGWLIQIFTAPIAILVDAVSFVASAAMVGRMRDPPQSAATGASQEMSDSILADIAAGLTAVWRMPMLRGMAVSGVFQNLSFGMFGTVYLLYVNQVVGFDPGVLGMIFAVGGVSAFAGAVIAGRTTRFSVGSVMIASLLLTALGEAFIPLATGATAAGIAFLVAQQIVGDAAYTVYDINQVSLRQTVAPAALLGRVNASMRVTEFGAILAGAVGAGYLGETVGLRPTLWLAVGLFFVAAVALAVSPVRSARRMTEERIEVAA